MKARIVDQLAERGSREYSTTARRGHVRGVKNELLKGFGGRRVVHVVWLREDGVLCGEDAGVQGDDSVKTRWEEEG